MHRSFLLLSRFMTIIGGLVLSLLIVMACLSILGRSLNTILHGPFFEAWMPGVASWLIDAGVGPINGDFEMIEAGIAFAIFAFLPLCQITGGHAAVDIFTNAMPRRVQNGLRLFTDLLFAAILVLIAVKLGSGTISKFNTGQTTLLLEFPLWWAYAASLIGAIIAAVVAVYIAVMRVLETATGTEILPADAGAEH